MKNILLVEDDTSIAMGLVYSLKQEGYDVTPCSTLADTRLKLKQQSFQLILLDIGLPDGTGYDICNDVKQSHHAQTPVIFLTACDAEVNVVMGLEMGADDYITKPFRVRELIARIKSVLRRSSSDVNTPTLRVGPLSIHTTQAKVFKNEEEVSLTALEYRLLMTLLNYSGQVLTRMQLLDGIWDVAGDFVNDNTLTVYIKRLREKLEDDPTQPKLIHTVRGFGYKLEASDEAK